MQIVVSAKLLVRRLSLRLKPPTRPLTQAPVPFCGTSYTHASSNCSPCPASPDQCPDGQACYAGITCLGTKTEADIDEDGVSCSACHLFASGNSLFLLFLIKLSLMLRQQVNKGVTCTEQIKTASNESGSKETRRNFFGKLEFSFKKDPGAHWDLSLI